MKAIKSKFLTKLNLVTHPNNDRLWILKSPLIYESELLGGRIRVPKNFYTDLASVPRIPIIYLFWGGRAHREAVLHDYAFRKDSKVIIYSKNGRIKSKRAISYSEANNLFFEAMVVRKKKMRIRYPMWWGVCLGGWTAYHLHFVNDKFDEA